MDCPECKFKCIIKIVKENESLREQLAYVKAELEEMKDYIKSDMSKK